MAQDRAAVPGTSIIVFGTVSVEGRSLDPEPPARMTACVTAYPSDAAMPPQ